MEGFTGIVQHYFTQALLSHESRKMTSIRTVKHDLTAVFGQCMAITADRHPQLESTRQLAALEPRTGQNHSQTHLHLRAVTCRSLKRTQANPLDLDNSRQEPEAISAISISVSIQEINPITC